MAIQGLVVQWLSHVPLCNPMNRNILGLPVLHYILAIGSEMLSNHLIFCCLIFFAFNLP